MRRLGWAIAPTIGASLWVAIFAFTGWTGVLVVVGVVVLLAACAVHGVGADE